jgi:CheY-like chemotaxis protein
MPVLDGLAATKIIRMLPGGDAVKIVAVTASAFGEQRSALLDVGFDELILKPYKSHELYDCLSRQLGVQYLQREKSLPTPQALVLTPAMLSVVPDSLRQNLENALTSLESARIARVIQQIAELDPQLSKTLGQLADNFNYPTILSALRGQ